MHLKVMPVASQRSTVQNPRTLFLRETGTGSPSFIVTEARGWRCRRFLNPFLPANHAENGSAAGVSCQMRT